VKDYKNLQYFGGWLLPHLQARKTAPLHYA